ncbi:MAG: hypothetical protein KAT50_05415 [Pirellulales bacterium]|nr:hypothetical protein [Pirellulales bacterium]
MIATSPEHFDFLSWSKDQRAWPLVSIGSLLVLSGGIHIIVWAVLGGPWEGAITWRKPILFGISGGLTAISMGWVWSKLPLRRLDGVLSWSVAIALLFEVALIDLQRWRGVASHFNRATVIDSLLYDGMGVLILWVTLLATDLMLRAFRQQMKASPDMVLAIQSGLVFLVLSCVLGIWVSVNGEMRMEKGLDPEGFGAEGVPKFPHGVVIHALQLLPALAWMAARSEFSLRYRERLITYASRSLWLLLLYALLETLLGRSRFDPPPYLAAMLFIAIAGLMIVSGMIVVGYLRMRFGQKGSLVQTSEE